MQRQLIDPSMNYGQTNLNPDEPVRATDTDAALARLSAVKLGYLQDPFIKAFVPRAHLQPARPPLINIGTYVRSEAIDRLVESWIDICVTESSKCQIVSLGAGSDSRFWRLATTDRGNFIAKYVEVDLADNTTKKAMAIRKSKDLSNILGTSESISLADGGTALHSNRYHLFAADLRKPPAESLGLALYSAPIELDVRLPTLLLFECVLVYLEPTISSTLIRWFTDQFHDKAPLGGVVYEMFGLEDSFGKVMKNNLKTRNVELPGAEPYPTIESLPKRFLSHQFTTANAMTLKDIRAFHIAPDELQRIAQIEMLDEVEELELVLAHYAITWGVQCPAEIVSDSGKLPAWRTWGFH